jgi:DNA-binding transcriptional MerR regulator
VSLFGILAEVRNYCGVTTVASEDVGVYSIGAVAKMLGIPVQTLRSWEDRYQQVVPARSAGGQRLYSRDDVERLRFVREQTEAGLQPADAHRLLAERTRERDHEPGRDRTEPPPGKHPAYVVLLAERDPYAAEFADYFLRTEGYTVHSVLDAAEATTSLADDAPNVLVVDLMISGGAGLALCRAARDSSSIPILAVSPLDSYDDALDAGVDAFLQKPLDPLRFVSTVRDLLGTSAYLRRGAKRR